MHAKTLVLNTDLEGLVFPVLDQISDNDFARVSTITVPFQTHESVPIDGLALIKFQLGQYIYPSYAYILENLAYDVALGA